MSRTAWFIAGGATVIGAGMYFMNNRSQVTQMEHKAAEKMEQAGDNIHPFLLIDNMKVLLSHTAPRSSILLGRLGQRNLVSSTRCLPRRSALADEIKQKVAEPAVEKLESALEAVADAAAPAAGRAGFPELPPLPLGETVLFQAFGWESHKDGQWYKRVQEKIPDLKASGITHLWLPPPSQSVAPQGYLPGQLYNLKSSYGNKEQLVELNRELLQAGIRPVADIVINHRCADKKDENGQWTNYGDDIDHEGRAIDWDKWAITSDDPVFDGTGNKDSGDDFEAAPDLDHANPELRASLTDWLNWLKNDVGFRGYRFDFVRGYAAKYLKEYIEKTIGHDSFNVGENFLDLNWNDGNLDYNQDGARQWMCDYAREAGECTMFDFVTKGILQEAVKNCQYDRLKDHQGKAPGMLGWWPEMTVTFVDNHDTGSTQQHWPFPNDHVMLGYAYILTHPGIPSIFWEHYFDWKLSEPINELVALRKRAGINSASKLEILCAEHDMYVARINDNVTVKCGPRGDMGGLVPAESDGWRMVQFGNDYAVWEKCGQQEAAAEEQ